MARRRYGSWGYFQTRTATEVERTSKRALADARKKGLDYHPVVLSGTTIARSWWGKSWCANLERYADYDNRLPRGRSYVRHQAVIDLQLGKGEAHGKVQGSSLYQVDIRFDPLNPKTEQELSRICSEQIQNVEELVSGKFPESLKERLFEKDGLFPSPREIHFRCSCPDWASMCKHVAAVMYGIGARLDDEPLGFFDLRGIQTDEFVAKAVASKVEDMLSHASRSSSRVIGDDQLQELFGLDLGGPAEDPALSSGSTGKASAVPEPQKRRGRPPKAAKQAEEQKKELFVPGPGGPAEEPALSSSSTGKASAVPEPQKRRGRPPKAAKQTEDRKKAKLLIQQSDYSEKVKTNLLKLMDKLPSEAFGQEQIMIILDSSGPTAYNYLKRLDEGLKLIVPAEEAGRGKYRVR